MSIAHREAVARRYVEAVDKRDVAAILSLYAPDARVEDPVGSTPIVGQDAIRAFYRDVIFPQIHSAELTGPVRCPENRAAFSFRTVSRNPGGGEPISTDIIDVFEFGAEGRVVSMKAYWTPL